MSAALRLRTLEEKQAHRGPEDALGVTLGLGQDPDYLPSLVPVIVQIPHVVLVRASSPLEVDDLVLPPDVGRHGEDQSSHGPREEGSIVSRLDRTSKIAFLLVGGVIWCMRSVRFLAVLWFGIWSVLVYLRLTGRL